jgi:1-acyl-sn-glycerol-3-phosphate acyltransferase
MGDRMGIVYRGSIGLEKLLLKAFADEWTVTGKENVPLDGGLIVVPNHVSNADPSMVATAFPRPVQFMAKDSLFAHPISRWFFNAYGAYPLKRSSIDVGAYRWARKLLEAERALVLFPEGKRGVNGLGPGLPGVARLALATGCPLLPVAVTGTEHLGPWYRVFYPTGRLTITIGKPFTLPAADGPPDKVAVARHTEQIMLRIAELLPESYRGIYAEPTVSEGE